MSSWIIKLPRSRKMFVTLSIGLLIVSAMYTGFGANTVSASGQYCSAPARCAPNPPGCTAGQEEQISVPLGCSSGSVCCAPVTPTPYPCEDLENQLLAPSCAFKQIPVLVGYVLDMTIIAAAMISLGAFFLGGYYYMMAQDRPDQLLKGRTIIKWAIVGTIFAASAYIIMRTIAPTLGFPIFGA